ncbi:hypothetical protein EBU71_18850, partial [bacterium]|nr:hypothetical protein [Candidatus Elulimicrobium humile]
KPESPKPESPKPESPKRKTKAKRKTKLDKPEPKPESPELEENDSDSGRSSYSRLSSKCTLVDQNGNTVEIEKLGTRKRKNETNEAYEQRMKKKVYDVICELRDRNIRLSRTHIRKVILNTPVAFLEDVLYSIVLKAVDGHPDWDIQQFDRKILKQLLTMKDIPFEKTFETADLAQLIQQNRSAFVEVEKYSM